MSIVSLVSRSAGQATEDLPVPPSSLDLSIENAPTPASFAFPALHRCPPLIGGHFGTKIETIIRHILYLIQTEPSDFKCCVFSRWEEVLDVFGSAFEENHVGVVRFSHSRQTSNKRHRPPHHSSSIHHSIAPTSLYSHFDAPVRFKTDPLIRVFLLNLNTESTGLTLVSARHVFMVEPGLDPAVDLQAIGRVHRLGQIHETWVHRYGMRNTVEEGVAHLCASKRNAMSFQTKKVCIFAFSSIVYGVDQVQRSP